MLIFYLVLHNFGKKIQLHFFFFICHCGLICYFFALQLKNTAKTNIWHGPVNGKSQIRFEHMDDKNFTLEKENNLCIWIIIIKLNVLIPERLLIITLN